MAGSPSAERAAKLVLLLGAVPVGALVLGPGTEAMRAGDGGAEAR